MEKCFEFGMLSRVSFADYDFLELDPCVEGEICTWFDLF